MGLEIIKHDLTEKQNEAVNYEGDELLIRGLAGSGKTVILLRRALKLVEENPATRIVLFTYNKTLCKYASDIAQKIAPNNLEVTTFHSWAYKTMQNVTGRRFIKVVGRNDPQEFLISALKAAQKESDHRFFTEERFHDFLLEEISWIKGRGIKTLSEYEQVSRIGRGSSVRVTIPDRRTIFKVFIEYENCRVKENKIEYDDFSNILWDRKKDITDAKKFNHVMVDEAQDLQLIQLKLLRYIAKDSFVVAADKGQRIYKTSFSWKEIGINITGGRTKILQNSFRSTKEIIQLANSLQLSSSFINDEEYVKPILPEFTGPMPDVYEFKSRQAQDIGIVTRVANLLEEYPTKTIGVLARTWKSIGRLSNQLQKKSINCETIKADKGSVVTPGVKLTTFHSAKGLEFDFVIIADLVDENLDIDFEDEESMGESIEFEKRLLYVPITRTKIHLNIYYYEEPSTILKDIDSKFYNKHISDN